MLVIFLRELYAYMYICIGRADLERFLCLPEEEKTRIKKNKIRERKKGRDKKKRHATQSR